VPEFRMPIHPLQKALIGVMILLMVSFPVLSKFFYLHTLAGRYVICKPMDGSKPFATVTTMDLIPTIEAFAGADVTGTGRFEFTDWSNEKRICNGLLYFVEDNYCSMPRS